jgi:serine/threonine protein kinase
MGNLHHHHSQSGLHKNLTFEYIKLVQPPKKTSDFYQVLRPIGAGVTGEVFEARENSTGRRFALKRIFSDVSQNVQFAALLCASLEKLRAQSRSPALTKIHELYYDDEGVLCIVMEYLDGRTLDAQLKIHGVLPEFYALKLTLRIAESLLSSYSDDLPFHGLLNPSNILLSPLESTAEHRNIKFLDYGTAKAANEYHKARHATARRKVTTALFSVGDPQYLSPEQCRETGEVDAQADVYGLGLVLFAMLAGRPPFVGNEPIKVMSMQMEAEPPSIQTIQERVSTFSKNLLHDALGKDPAKRPALSLVVARLKEHISSKSPDYDGYKVNHFVRADRYAAVYSALHAQSKEPAVIKLIDPERTVGAFRQVAARCLTALEMQANEKLTGFVPLQGFGQLPDQQVYAVLPPPSGISLAEAITSHASLDSQVWQDRTLLIGKRLAEIISQFHAEKVLYLGLRPSNVRTIDDERASDGIVIQLLDSETIRSVHRGEQTLRGSDLPENLSLDIASYIAPEQVLGAADAPADVYALGVILYEMLGGQKPLSAPTVEELLAMHQKVAPRRLDGLNRVVSIELVTLIHAMMEKVPSRRPTMAQVAKELLLFAESVETQRFSPLSLQELQKFEQRRRQRPETLDVPIADIEPITDEVTAPAKAATEDQASSIHAAAAQLVPGPQPPDVPPEQPKRPRVSRPPKEDAGARKMIGEYQVVRRLGEGGMGAVYEALAPDTGLRVAIKQPRPELMIMPAFAERFFNEVRFAKRINHSGVVSVLHFDRTDDGLPFIVMELMEGDTLRSCKKITSRLYEEGLCSSIGDRLCGV